MRPLLRVFNCLLSRRCFYSADKVDVLELSEAIGFSMATVFPDPSPFYISSAAGTRQHERLRATLPPVCLIPGDCLAAARVGDGNVEMIGAWELTYSFLAINFHQVQTQFWIHRNRESKN